MTRFQIGSRWVGDGNCLVIAEAGVNHNGDISRAHQLVDVAADAGADAVKFQTFIPEELVSARAPKAQYQVETTGQAGSQLEMLRALVLPPAAYRELADHASQRGIVFLSTAFDHGSADALDDLGMVAFKIPSGEVTNLPFLDYLCAKGKPVLLSTGMASLAEVEEAVAVIRARKVAFALLHCVSAYPAPADQCNLLAMETMRARFGVPVGWSDHTLGTAVAVGAAALGADLIEKHITIDRTLPGPDHRASLEPDEVRRMVDDVRAAHAARGDGIKRPTAAEADVARVARRSLHARRALPAGHVLAAEDLIAVRPAGGLRPGLLPKVVGRTLVVPMDAGEMLEERHLA